MKPDYYVFLASTSVILHILPLNCSLSIVTRNKRAADNTVHTSADGKNAQSQTSDHKPVFDEGELLLQYLQAFNNAIKENADTKEGGLGKTLEIEFPLERRTQAEYVFYVMLNVYFKQDKSIEKGKMETVAAVEKISIGRKFLSTNFGLKKNYIPMDHAMSIVDTALQANWASVVGGYLVNKQQQYLSELKQVTNSQLTGEGIKLESHMKSIRKLLSDAQTFFGKLAASLGKKVPKTFTMETSNGEQYFQIANIFNPAAELNSNKLLYRLVICLNRNPQIRVQCILL